MPSWLSQGNAITLEQLRPHAGDAFPFGNGEVAALLSLAVTHGVLRVIAVPYTPPGTEHATRERQPSKYHRHPSPSPGSTLSFRCRFSLYQLVMSSSQPADAQIRHIAAGSTCE